MASNMRIGHGYDVHRLVEGRRCIIGGVDIPYEKGKSFVVTVDGFIVSRNVTVERAEVIDTGFLWSDHNPVRLTFTLGG